MDYKVQHTGGFPSSKSILDEPEVNILDRFSEVVDKHSLKGKDEFFSITAAVGELGELCNVRKKLEYTQEWPEYSASVRKKVSDGEAKDFREQSVDEWGDTLFYLFQTMQKQGITPQECMEYQIEKLAQQSRERGKTFKK